MRKASIHNSTKQSNLTFAWSPNWFHSWGVAALIAAATPTISQSMQPCRYPRPTTKHLERLHVASRHHIRRTILKVPGLEKDSLIWERKYPRYQQLPKSLPNSYVKPFGECQRINSWTSKGGDSYLDPHTPHLSFVSKEYPHQFTTFESLGSRSLRDVSFHIQQAKKCE
jgi:hypothetical protein